MFRVTHSWAAIALLVVVAATVCIQRPARANDTGALIGGLIAGAIVYELLDDDDDGYCRRYHRGYYSPGPYYRPPTYYPSYPRYYGPSGGVTIWYDECYPSRRTYGYRDCGPSHRYGDGWRGPSQGKRNVGPPRGYGKPGKRGGGRYRPPKCYR